MKNYPLGNLLITIPEGWHEITLSQFLASINLKDKSDVISILSILSGQDYKTIFDQEDSGDEFSNLLSSFEWVLTLPDFKGLPVPDYIVVNEKHVTIPKNLTLSTFGQKITFEQLILSKAVLRDDKPVCPFELTAKAMAIYLYPVITNQKFDSEKTGEIEQQLMELPFLQCYSIANFFLNRYMESQKTKEQPSVKPRPTSKSLRKSTASKNTVS